MPEEYLVGGLDHFLFFHIGNFIIPTDELHHFSEGLKPPTRSELVGGLNCSFFSLFQGCFGRMVPARNQAGRSRCWWSVLPKISSALSVTGVGNWVDYPWLKLLVGLICPDHCSCWDFLGDRTDPDLRIWTKIKWGHPKSSGQLCESTSSPLSPGFKWDTRHRCR